MIDLFTQNCRQVSLSENLLPPQQGNTPPLTAFSFAKNLRTQCRQRGMRIRGKGPNSRQHLQLDWPGRRLGSRLRPQCPEISSSNKAENSQDTCFRCKARTRSCADRQRRQGSLNRSRARGIRFCQSLASRERRWPCSPPPSAGRCRHQRNLLTIFVNIFTMLP